MVRNTYSAFFHILVKVYSHLIEKLLLHFVTHSQTYLDMKHVQYMYLQTLHTSSK